MSLSDEILRNLCKRDKIPAVVIMRGAEDNEPSYKGLKPAKVPFANSRVT